MLLNSVPQSLMIDGTEYKINTDYRVWIKFEIFLTEFEDESEDILTNIKQLIFLDKIPPSAVDEETVAQLLWFYKCGKEIKTNSKSKSSQEIFSYDYDDGYICGAFMEQYQIDLNAANLHWWKFRALMMSLSDSTEFVKIMGYRAIEITSKMTSEQKDFYRKMKKHYAIPIKKELQQKYTDIENALINGENIDNLI
jgi:hypothetical protein